MILKTKYGLFYCFLALFVAFAFDIKSNDTVINEDLCSLENQSFISGEELVFKVYYNWKFIWVPAGQVKFVVQEFDSVYVVDVKGASYPSYDSFFKVRDRYKSIIDKETLLPKLFVRDIAQGDYVRYDSMVIDQSEYQLTEYYGKSRDRAKPFEFQLDRCTQDLVSVLYHLRNRDIEGLAKGSKLPVSFFFSRKQYNLDVNIIDRKRKKIKGLGKFDVIHARPELITGSVFDENSYMDVFVSDDQNKVPLLVESPLRVGSAKAVLLSHKNLKFSFKDFN